AHHVEADVVDVATGAAHHRLGVVPGMPADDVVDVELVHRRVGEPDVDLAHQVRDGRDGGHVRAQGRIPGDGRARSVVDDGVELIVGTTDTDHHDEVAQSASHAWLCP